MHLHLFGSIVRRDAWPDSDVDLAAQFDRAKTCSLLDVSRIRNKLTDILGMPADLSDADRLKAYDIALPGHAQVPKLGGIPLRVFWYSEPSFSAASNRFQSTA